MTERDPDRLNAEFKTWCESEYLRFARAPGNRVTHFVWNPAWTFDKAAEIGRRWRAYIDPLAVEWWKARGYRFLYQEGDAFIDALPDNGELSNDKEPT